MENLVNFLKNKNQTISSMESCTGGLFASELTNVNGSSNVFKLGLITYSNEYKEYFGVSKQAINEYTVYSNEVSREMAQKCCDIAKSDLGVGITGMLGAIDPANPAGEINSVYISIYSKKNNSFHDFKIEAIGNTRYEKKQYVVKYIKERLYEICK